MNKNTFKCVWSNCRYNRELKSSLNKHSNEKLHCDKSYKFEHNLKTHQKCTVANFSPEHSGTEKDQRGYPLCLKSEIFIFIIKSFNT
jgi:hypothetical protein